MFFGGWRPQQGRDKHIVVQVDDQMRKCAYPSTKNARHVIGERTNYKNYSPPFFFLNFFGGAGGAFL